MKTFERNNAHGTDRGVVQYAVGLHPEETSRLDVIFETGIVAVIRAYNHGLRRVRRTALTEEPHFAAHLFISVVHENHLRLPIASVRKLRNCHLLTNSSRWVGDRNGTQKRFRSFIRKETKSSDKHRRRSAEIYSARAAGREI